MKKMLVIASLLLGLSGSAVHIQAQEPSVPEIKQKVSKLAKKLAPHAAVQYRGAPQFASIPGTSITYATNSPQTVLHVGDAFYLHFTYYYPLVHNTRNVWLISADAQGPWAPTHYLPEVIPEVVCSEVNAFPPDPYQLCALPWESGFIYVVWRPS
jgi:hypothetical protein